MNFTRLSFAFSLFTAGFFLLLCLEGCTEHSTADTNTGVTVSGSEQDFQKEDNRPPTAKTLYAMADILAAQGRDTECEFVLKRIVRENPRYLPAYNSLAELQMRQGHVKSAIETLNNAFDINPDDPLLLNNMGVCWIICKDYEKALEMFSKAAGIKPENTRYRMNMALALGLMGRYDESLSLFRQVLPEDQANHNLSVLKNVDNNLSPASAL